MTADHSPDPTPPSLAQMVAGLTRITGDNSDQTAGTYQVQLSPWWMQGRTAFGGITAALALAATRQALPDLPRLRSMQVAFLRPLSDVVDFQVTLIRAGRTASFVQVDCLSGDALGARVTMVFGADRPSQIIHDFTPQPDIPDPDSLPELIRRSSAPNFFANFDARVISGDPLASGSDRPELIIWSRLRAPDGVTPEIALICNADSLPPAAMTAFAERAPVSTITWSLDFAHMPERTDWLWCRTTSKQAADGYSVQDMELRDRKGHLIAGAQQLVALFT